MLTDRTSPTINARQRAKSLRQDQTPGEKMLWMKLRAQRFHGYKFRRQVPVGPYIVDFLCVEENLIIEIDGSSHWEPGAQERDRDREAYLQSLGFRILRFTNLETVQSLATVLERLRLFLEGDYDEATDDPSPLPSPSGRGNT